MIYVVAISLLLLNHLIYYSGKKGYHLAIKFEKIAVFISVMASFVAIVELGDCVSSFFAQQGDLFTGWLPSMLIYPVGFILFLLVIFVALPKPIQEQE